MFGTEYIEWENYNYWLCLKYILTYRPVDDDDNIIIMATTTLMYQALC